MPEAWGEFSQGLSEQSERNPWFVPQKNRTPAGVRGTYCKAVGWREALGSWKLIS